MKRPRYRGDRFEGGPVDPRVVRESPYDQGEFERFVSQLRDAMQEA